MSEQILSEDVMSDEGDGAEVTQYLSFNNTMPAEDISQEAEDIEVDISKMKHVLLIADGSVGHAIAWGLSVSKHVEKVFVSPPCNGLISEDEKISSIIRPLDDKNIEKVCQEIKVSTIISNKIFQSEIINKIKECGILYFGPIDDANMFGDPSRIREFFHTYNIQTSKAVIFKAGDPVKFDESKLHFKSVLKTPSDTIFTRTKGEARRKTLEYTAELLAMQNIVLEECLDGVEISVTAFYNGDITEILPITRILKGNGAECPYVEFTTAEEATIKQIMRNLGAGLQNERIIYIGVLCARFIIAKNGPKVVNMTCKFKDPETQAILPLMKKDFARTMIEKLIKVNYITEFSRNSASCLVFKRDKKKNFINLKSLPQDQGTFIFIDNNKEPAATVVAIDCTKMRAEKKLKTKQLEMLYSYNMDLESKKQDVATITEPKLVTVTDVIQRTKMTLAENEDDEVIITIDGINRAINKLLMLGAKPVSYIIFKNYVEENKTIIRQSVEEGGCHIDEQIDITTGDVQGVCVGQTLNNIQERNTMRPGDAVIAINDTFSLSEREVKAFINIMDRSQTKKTDSFGKRTFGEILISQCTKSYIEITKYRRMMLGVDDLSGGLEGVVCPADITISLDAEKWDIPPIFYWIKNKGNLDEKEMTKFNLGIGMVMIVRGENKEYVINNFVKKEGVQAKEIGELITRKDSNQLIVKNLASSLYKAYHKNPGKRTAVLLENKDISLKKTLKEDGLIQMVISTSLLALAKEEAEQAGIPTNVFKREDFGDQFEEKLLQCLKEGGINYLISIDAIPSANFIEQMGENSTLQTSVSIIQDNFQKAITFKEDIKKALLTESQITGVTLYYSNVEDLHIKIVDQGLVKISCIETEETLTEKLYIELDSSIMRALTHI